MLSRAARTRELEVELEVAALVVVVVVVARILGGSLVVVVGDGLFREDQEETEEGGLGAAVSFALVLAFVRTILGMLGVLTAVEVACWSRDRILRPTGAGVERYGGGAVKVWEVLFGLVVSRVLGSVI